MKASDLSKEDLAQLAIAIRKSDPPSKGRYTELVESIDKRLEHLESLLGADDHDTIGFSVVTIAGGCVDKSDEWHEEFRQWYKPGEWLGSHRAAAVFLGMKFAGLPLSAQTEPGK